MSPNNDSTIDVDEPKLTYERILNDLSDITRTDSITSSCLHNKFFAIGTLYGRIHVFDHQGNKVNRQELCFHLKSVDSISIDERGEYLASSSSDRLVVYGLCDGKPYFNIMPDKPLNVVAIDPYFHKPDGGRRFVTGDDRLVLYERGLLTRHKSTVLQTKEQKPIRSVSWHGQFIAWATDNLAQVFDVEQRAIITRINRESDINLSWDNYCQFSWKDNRTLVIGWCNTVKICVIKDRSRDMINESQLRELPKKYVEIISIFETEFPISGLAPFNESLFTLSINYPDIMPSKHEYSYLETQSVSGLSMTSHQSVSTSIAGQSQVFFNNENSIRSNHSIGSNNYIDFTQQQTNSIRQGGQALSQSPSQSSMNSQTNDSNVISGVCDGNGTGEEDSSSMIKDDNTNCDNSNNSNNNLIRPQIHIIETFPNSYNELSKDILTPNACLTVQQFLSEIEAENKAITINNIPSSSSSMMLKSRSNLNRTTTKPKMKRPYTLLSLHDEGLYFIVCAKDIISARPRDYDDHIDWLIQHKMLKEAYTFSKEYSSELCRYSIREIEELYMRDLIDKNTNESFGEAAKLCTSICGQDQKAWDKAIKQFCDFGQLKYLIAHIPKGLDGDNKPESFHLEKESYNLILNEFLKTDSVSFFRAIKEIPSQLYDLQLITDKVIRNLANDPKDLILNEALAELYTCVGNFEDAVNIYLDYNDKTRIFTLIRNNNLVSILRDRVDRLMQIDADETSKLLVENVDYIPMPDIVDRLEGYKSKRYLVSYLHRLIQRDPDSCIEYHDLMVRLYAQYQPNSLLNFLKTSTNYSLEEALTICKEANMIKEVVYLLGRMGDLRIALRYIVESQGIHEAIEFCKEHQDSDMWQDLIIYSMDKPAFVSALLKNIGTHINDPIDLIDRIPNGCEIEGLMPALVKILQDYQLQISLEKCCRDLMSKDCYSLLQKQISGQTQGIAVREDQLCDHCNQPLLSDTVLDNMSQSRSIESDQVGAGSAGAAGVGAHNSAPQHHSTSTSSPGTRPQVAASSSGMLNDLVVFGCHHVFHEECCDLAATHTSASNYNSNNTNNKNSENNTQEQELETSKLLSCRVCMLEKDDDSLAPG